MSYRNNSGRKSGPKNRPKGEDDTRPRKKKGKTSNKGKAWDSLGDKKWINPRFKNEALKHNPYFAEETDKERRARIKLMRENQDRRIGKKV